MVRRDHDAGLIRHVRDAQGLRETGVAGGVELYIANRPARDEVAGRETRDFPIAVRQALPAYGNEIILMVKATSLASIITMMELTGIAHKLISQTFRAV